MSVGEAEHYVMAKAAAEGLATDLGIRVWPSRLGGQHHCEGDRVEDWSRASTTRGSEVLVGAGGAQGWKVPSKQDSWGKGAQQMS